MMKLKAILDVFYLLAKIYRDIKNTGLYEQKVRSDLNSIFAKKIELIICLSRYYWGKKGSVQLSPFPLVLPTL
jgi:hypothetical protein